MKIPPGAQLPDHFHEGTQVARVVEGVLTYDVISGTVVVTRRDGSTRTVGETGAVTYGWNRLTGTTTDAGSPVQVELLGNVAYTNGSGPFFGFVTFTFADGSVLGTQVQASRRSSPTGPPGSRRRWACSGAPAPTRARRAPARSRDRARPRSASRSRRRSRWT